MHHFNRFIIMSLALIWLSTPTAAQYQPVCPYILDPDQAIQYIEDELSFFDRARDNLKGGYFSIIDQQGYPTVNTTKSLCAQSRLAYAYCRAFMVTGNTSYIEKARHALNFLYKNGWDQTNKGWFFSTDVNGTVLNVKANQRRTSFQQHYALLGIMAMVEATGGNLQGGDGSNLTDEQWLQKGLDINYQKLWDSRASYLGYYLEADLNWANPRGKDFNSTVDALTTHAFSLVLNNKGAQHNTRLFNLTNNVMDYLVGFTDNVAAGFPGTYDAQWAIDSSKTRCEIGHIMKTSWCLAQSYMLDPTQERYRQGAKKVIYNLVNHGGYDNENGGIYRAFDWKSGALVDNTKDYWMLEQGYTGGMTNYFIANNQADKDLFLKIADGSLQFYMNYMVDHINGGSFSQTDRYGAVVNNTKGDLYKAGYHAVELGYYAYLFGNLMYHNTPVTLYYNITAQNSIQTIKLTPLAFIDNQLAISAVTRNGSTYSSFNALKRELTIPAGVGGIFGVEFSPLMTAEKAPYVKINSPVNDTQITTAQTINLSANASDIDGTISNVKFYNGTSLITTLSNSPYNFSWSNMAPGTHHISAVATDNSGLSTTSETVDIIVAPPQGSTAFNESNGLVCMEAENYTDLASNSDITNTWQQQSSKPNFAGSGYIVAGPNSNAVLGSWTTGCEVSYKVNFVTSGTYYIWIRSDCNGNSSDNSLFLGINNTVAGGSFSSSNSSFGWNRHATTIKVPTTGEHTFQMRRREDGFMIDRIVLTTSSGYNPGTINGGIGPQESTRENNNVNRPPQVSIVTPVKNATFTAPATVTIEASASDSDGTISCVNFYRDNILLSTDSIAPYSCTWPNVAAGSYTITATAYDNGGSSATSGSVPVTVTTAVAYPPTVSLNTPAESAVYTAPATIAISATASDNDGTISEVRFYVGESLLAVDNSAPYTYTMSNITAGTYAIKAVALDNASLTASVQKTVFVIPPSNVSLVLESENAQSKIETIYRNSAAPLGWTGTGWIRFKAPNSSITWTGVNAPAGEKNYSFTVRHGDDKSTKIAKWELRINNILAGTYTCNVTTQWNTATLSGIKLNATNNTIELKCVQGGYIGIDNLTIN